MVINYGGKGDIAEKIVMRRLPVDKNEFAASIEIAFSCRHERKPKQPDHSDVVEPSDRADHSDSGGSDLMPEKPFHGKRCPNRIWIGIYNDIYVVLGAKMRIESVEEVFPGFPFGDGSSNFVQGRMFHDQE